MDMMRLSDVGPCCACRVVRVDEESAALAEMGVTEGAVLTRLFTAPGGEPTAYLVRDAVFALRRKDADRVIVTCTEPSI